jgi:hypothetical protein
VKSPFRFLCALGALALVFFFAGCAGEPDAPPETEAAGPVNEPEPLREYPEVEDFPGKGQDGEMPDWVAAYLAAGARGIEALPDYQGLYAFVSENHGASLPPLEQWASSYRVSRAFGRTAAERFRRRFLRDISASADEVYGRYYEGAVKAFYNARFSEPAKADEFWIAEEKPAQGDEPGGAEYRYFILLLVPQDVFQKRMMEILDSVRYQNEENAKESAFEKVRDDFFTGF